MDWPWTQRDGACLCQPDLWCHAPKCHHSSQSHHWLYLLCIFHLPFYWNITMIARCIWHLSSEQASLHWPLHSHYFQIPKIHMMEHYVALIHSKGSTDGFNTELECLHIDCAKEGYCASNKKNYTQQMIKYLTHHEYSLFFITFATLSEKWNKVNTGISHWLFSIRDDLNRFPYKHNWGNP